MTDTLLADPNGPHLHLARENQVTGRPDPETRCTVDYRAVGMQPVDPSTVRFTIDPFTLTTPGGQLCETCDLYARGEYAIPRGHPPFEDYTDHGDGSGTLPG